MSEIKIGQNFGQLTVKERGEDYIYPNGKKRLKRWLCQCNCGKESLYYQNRLITGKSVMCIYCSSKNNKGRSIYKDLTGHKFGKFTVIKQVEKPKKLKNGGTYWLCRCECGNTKIIKASEIKRNKGLSCGQCGFNTYNLSGEYGIGYTTKGKPFYFDKEDYDKIKNYSWSVTKLGYLIAYNKGSDNEFIYLHRLILGLDKMNKFDVDHINHKVNDNRKENLRVCTHQDNIMNSKLSKNNKSGVTGVRFETSFNKWIACIMLNYKTIHLGLYNNFDDAVKARKDAEEKYFGEYAYKEGDNI